jgi:hypothetical protein
MRFIKLIIVLMALAIFISAAFAEEPYGSPSTGSDCMVNPPVARGGGGELTNKYHGYTQFPIEAPKRYEKQANPRDVLPEDKSFIESLRMLLGVETADNPNCPRKRSFRGLLNDEK